MLKFITSPFILIPICIGLWILIKRHHDALNHAKWVRYQQHVRDTAIVSREVMTENEKEFFSRLKGALPDLEIIPQVAMSALLDVTLPPMHPQYWEIRHAFSQKTVDYVICRPKSMQVITVVELDDRTHDAKQDKDAARDAMLAKAGIKTVRWDSRAKPSAWEIREMILPLAAAA